MNRRRKTVNPLRRPATEADVLRAKAEDYIIAEIRARCELDELKPCPFCGGEAIVTEHYGMRKIFVQCRKCFATFPSFATRKDAEDAWNRRKGEVD